MRGQQSHKQRYQHQQQRKTLQLHEERLPSQRHLPRGQVRHLPGHCRRTPKRTKKYIGLTEGPFKTRYTGHKQSFTNKNKEKATALSKYVWDNELQPAPSIKYEILKHARPLKPGARSCDLCLSEKVAIMNVKGDQTYLNKRTEIKKVCPHRTKHTLKQVR